MNAQDFPSTRPYLIRALHEWCTDNGFTPYVAVRVDGSVLVPREYVKDGEIVLNISCDATSSLQLGNDFIEFKARFGGKPREIMVPVARVIAIYARENGQGMAFPPPVDIVTAMGEMGEADWLQSHRSRKSRKEPPRNVSCNWCPVTPCLMRAAVTLPVHRQPRAMLVLPSNASNSILRVSNTLNLQDKMQPSPI